MYVQDTKHHHVVYIHVCTIHHVVYIIIMYYTSFSQHCLVFFFFFCFRQIFCDFGDSFIVSDTDGEQPISVLISSITRVSVASGACVGHMATSCSIVHELYILATTITITVSA